MRKICRSIWVLAFSVGVLFAQQETGNIFVSVTSGDGSALPGVTVSTTGRYLLSPRTGVTNEDGKYSIRNLPVGPYEVTLTMAGFKTVKVSDIQVNLGSTTNLPVKMQVSDIEEVLTVTSGEPSIDLTTANTGKTFDVEILNELPTTKDPWGILEATPGVVMSQDNVGGNKQGTQARFSAKGASPYQNAYYIDGVNLTDTSASGATGQYYDFDSFEQIAVSTGAHDASMGAPGVNISMVTKSGSNQFEGRVGAVYSSSSWTSKNAVEVNGRELDTSLDENTDYNLSIGGPIIKDKLWFFAAYHKNEVDLFTPNTRYSETPVIDATELEQINLNMKWAITATNNLKFAYNENDKSKSNRLPTWPSSIDYTLNSYAGWAQSGPGDAWYLMDEWSINDTFMVSAKYGQQTYPFTLGIHGSAPDDVLTRYPVHLNTNTGVPSSGYDYPIYDRENETMTLKGSYFGMFGSASHDISFGIDYLGSDNSAEDVYPGNAIVYQYDATEGEVWFLRPVRSVSSIDNTALFLNDVITSGKWTFNLGLRYQSQKGSIGGGTVQGTWQNVPDAVALEFAQRFGSFDVQPINDAAKWNDLVPRINISYDISGDGRQVVKLGLNRYAYTLNTSDFEKVSALSEYEEDYGWVDLDGNGMFLGDGSDWNEVNFDELYWSSGSGSGTPIADGYHAPTVDEIILNYSHEFDNAIVLSGNYTYRKTSDPTYTLDRGKAGLENWTEGSVVDAFGNTRTFYTWNGGTYNQDNVLTNQGGFSTKYSGVELTVSRATSKYSFLASLTYGSTDESFDLNEANDPNTALGDARRADLAGSYGSKYNAKILCSYNLPWNVTLASKVRYNSGNYYFISQSRDASGARFNDGRGSVSLIINDPETDHLDSFLLFDLGAIKNFKIGDRFAFEVRMDFFNLLNENQSVSYTSYDISSSAFERPSEILGPRTARLGLALTF